MVAAASAASGGGRARAVPVAPQPLGAAVAIKAVDTAPGDADVRGPVVVARAVGVAGRHCAEGATHGPTAGERAVVPQALVLGVTVRASSEGSAEVDVADCLVVTPLTHTVGTARRLIWNGTARGISAGTCAGRPDAPREEDAVGLTGDCGALGYALLLRGRGPSTVGLSVARLVHSVGLTVLLAHVVTDAPLAVGVGVA